MSEMHIWNLDFSHGLTCRTLYSSIEVNGCSSWLFIISHSVFSTACKWAKQYPTHMHYWWNGCGFYPHLGLEPAPKFWQTQQNVNMFLFICTFVLCFCFNIWHICKRCHQFILAHNLVYPSVFCSIAFHNEILLYII